MSTLMKKINHFLVKRSNRGTSYYGTHTLIGLFFSTFFSIFAFLVFADETISRNNAIVIAVFTIPFGLITLAVAIAHGRIYISRRIKDKTI